MYAMTVNESATRADMRVTLVDAKPKTDSDSNSVVVMLSWVERFLSGRTHYVSINNVNSELLVYTVAIQAEHK